MILRILREKKQSIHSRHLNPFAPLCANLLDLCNGLGKVGFCERRSLNREDILTETSDLDAVKTKVLGHGIDILPGEVGTSQCRETCKHFCYLFRICLFLSNKKTRRSINIETKGHSRYHSTSPKRAHSADTGYAADILTL